MFLCAEAFKEFISKVTNTIIYTLGEAKLVLVYFIFFSWKRVPH